MGDYAKLYGVDITNPTGPTNPLPVSQPSVSLSNGTATNVTVTTASQYVVFFTACTQITVNNTHATNILYLNPFGGVSSASKFPINPGQAFTWSAAPGLTQIALYASAANTVVGVLAH